MARNVRMWALSTCGWCKKTKRYLEEHGIAYTCTDVDLLPPAEKPAAREELSRYNPKRSYPTVVIDDEVVVRGYDPDQLAAHLGL